jgi:succinate-semialdehyde dehydrogenase
MDAINPATGQTLRTYPEHDDAEIERRLALATTAFASWRRVPIAERAALLRAVSSTLRRERDRLARLMTEEMGKPIAQAEAEVEKCALACDHFADHGPADLEPIEIGTEAARSFVRFDPLGPLLAVMPWNFPMWQVFRAAVPALLAGNVVLLKHASNVPGCALAAEEVFHAAGFPDGAFSALLIGSAAAEALVEHPAVRAVTLTGSEGAGIAIARRAGQALKKCVLELGGSDPFVVLADADLEKVAAAAVAGRLVNNGESCIAAKRFIVEETAAERFEWLFGQRMARLRMGDPLDRSTELGPLARPDLVDALDRQVKESVARGARIVTGGARPTGPGWFYPPTVLARVTPGMPAFDEETFGPVAAVTRARDADHALELANASRFGLGASVWTSDPARALDLARDLEAGSVFVNEIVKSDPRLPFGGVKRSGYGRELSAFGLREFVNVKTVWAR